jgi:hypothetical protein
MFFLVTKKIVIKDNFNFFLKAWKVCRKLDLKNFQFGFHLTTFLFLLHLRNLKKLQGV